MGRRQRLALAFAPSVVGLFLVSGLAYWGEFGHAVPALVLITGVIATMSTFGIGAWVARQVDPANIDAALQVVRDAAARELAEARAQTDEHRLMLKQIVSSMGHLVQEVQLPLHILLDTPFGALNENQEELLGVARESAESADAELRLLRRLLDEPCGFTPEPEAITVGALLAPALAVVTPVAEAALVHLVIDVATELPTVRVPVAAIQESLVTVLLVLLAALPNGSELALHAQLDGETVSLRIVPPLDSPSPSFRLRLAIRLLHRYAEWVVDQRDGCRMRFPVTDLLRRVG